MSEFCCRCGSQIHTISWDRRLQGYICAMCFESIKIENELAVSGTLIPEKIHIILMENEG